jgi:hypothetical protein
MMDSFNRKKRRSGDHGTLPSALELRKAVTLLQVAGLMVLVGLIALLAPVVARCRSSRPMP